MRLARLRRPVPRYSRAVQPDHLPLRRKSPDERPPERVRSGCRSRNRIRSRGQRSPHGCSRTRTARGSSNGGCLNPSCAHLSWLSTPVRGSPCENYCPYYIILFYQSEEQRNLYEKSGECGVKSGEQANPISLHSQLYTLHSDYKSIRQADSCRKRH